MLCLDEVTLGLVEILFLVINKCISKYLIFLKVVPSQMFLYIGKKISFASFFYPFKSWGCFFKRTFCSADKN